MGWLDGRSSSSSYRFVRSPSRKSPYSTYHSHHSAPSIFNLGGGGSSHYSRSGSSIFSSSSRRARPRSGFLRRIIHKIKRLLRDIYYFLRRHPMRVFMLVIMPLLTGGVLQKLFGMLGIRLPGGLLGTASRSGMGEHGLEGSLGGLMNLAKTFV